MLDVLKALRGPGRFFHWDLLKDAFLNFKTAKMKLHGN